jgi:hypothetical protein
MKKIALLLLLLSCLVTVKQSPAQNIGSRYDSVATTTTTIGNIPAITPLAGATIAVCSYPANAVPCTNYANTFSDATLGTICPTNAQVVLQSTTSCISNSDPSGNFGFWSYEALLDYTVTYNGLSYGPFHLNPGFNPAQPIMLASGTTLAVSSINNVLYANAFSGADICAKATAAFASLPSTAVGATVHLGGGGLTQAACANPIVLPKMTNSASGAASTRLVLDGDGMTIYASSGYTGDLITVNTVGVPYKPVEIENLFIFGNSASTGCGIHTKDTGGFHIHDGASWGFGLGSGICVEVTSGSQSEYGVIDNWDSGFNQSQIRYYGDGGNPSALYNTVGPGVHLDITDIGGQCATAPYCNVGIEFDGVQTQGGSFEVGYNANSNNQFAPVAANNSAEVYRTKFTLRGELTSGSGKGCLFWAKDSASIMETENTEISNTALDYDTCAPNNITTGWPASSGFRHANNAQDTYYVAEGGGTAQWRLSIQNYKSPSGWMSGPTVIGGGYRNAFSGVNSDQGHDWGYQWTTRSVGQTYPIDEEANQHEVGFGATLSITASAGVITSCAWTGGNFYFNPVYTLSGGTGGVLNLSQANGVPTTCAVTTGGTGYTSGTVPVTSQNNPVNNVFYMDGTGGGNMGFGPGFVDSSGLQIPGQASGCNIAPQVIAFTTLARTSNMATGVLASAPNIPSGCWYIVEGAFDPNFNAFAIASNSTFSGTTMTFPSVGLNVTSAFGGGTLIGPVQFPQATIDDNGTFRLDATNGGTTYNHIQTYSISLTPVATAANTCALQTFTGTTFSTSPLENLLSLHPPSAAMTAGMSIPNYWINGSTGSLNLQICNNTAGSLTAPSGTYTIVGIY